MATDNHQQEGADQLVVVSRCVSAAGIRFLVILFPPRSWAFLTVGLPARPQGAGRTQTGFPCFARTSCDRGGCPLYSGDGGAHPDRGRSPASACRNLSDMSLRPATASRRYGALLHEASTKGSSDFTRPIFPSPVALGWNERPLGFSPELRTPPLRATHVEVGTGHRARTCNTLYVISTQPPILRVDSMRATSRRTRRSRSRSGVGRSRIRWPVRQPASTTRTDCLRDRRG